ncbi:hypothetical protein HYW83_00360 [Candidatus Peregrinibacteria bacterium]|nr:hypothetical protein [Candidatus Peregrinibacteria bacterium]
MDPKKKTKIWIIIFFITLSLAGGLAVFLNKKTTLFKGIVMLDQDIADDLAGAVQYQPACSSYTQNLCLLHLDRCHVVGFQCVAGAYEMTDLTPKPDLRINSADMSVSPANPAAGSQPTFSARIFNNGNANAVGSMARLRIDQGNNNSYESSNIWTIPISSIATSAFATATFSNKWTAVPGPSKFKICADATFGVTESNENNNCDEKTFEVAAAPPAPPNATLTVSIDPLTPQTRSVEQGAIDQDITKLKFVAAGGDINITQIKVTRSGMGVATDVTSTSLYEGANTIGTAAFSNNIATFTNLPIHMNTGIIKTLTLKVNIAQPAAVGNKVKLGIAAVADVTAAGSTVSGSFPIYGNEFTIAAPAVVIASNDLPQANKTEPADNSTINTLTPVLRWNTNGIEVGSKQFHFRWEIDDMNINPPAAILRREYNWVDGGPGNTAPPNFPRKCPTNAIVPGLDNPWTCTELQIPTGVLQYGQSYRWFVHVNNGNKETSWCNPQTAASISCTGTDGAKVYFNFTTPPPPSVTVTASRPAGQSEQIPAAANQTVKLATLNISQSGGEPMLTRLKRIVLEYQTADNPLEISKISDLHLFRGDSSEFTLGATGKDLIILSKNSTNGTIEAVFQTVTPVSVIGDTRNQSLTLYAKINGSAGDNGKKIKYVVKSVEFEPGDGNQTNLNIAVPEFTMHEDPPNAPAATFQAAPASINKGQSTTLTWTVTGATTMNIDQGIGNIQGTGSRTVSPTTDTTYILSATNAGGTITRTVAIAVAQPAAPQVTFQAAPASINKGQSTTLTWTVTGATTMNIDQGIGNIQGTGSRTVSPTTDTTYTLSATNAEGTVTRTVAITVAQLPPPGQTCEQQGLKTYTGPPKPGERVTGMCIACTTEQYIANGGTCEAKKKKKVGNMDRGLPQAGGGQAGTAGGAAATGAANAGAVTQQSQGDQRGSAPDLQASQRLVRAPERANTGPETLVYLGILSVVHAGLWLRRKMKR